MPFKVTFQIYQPGKLAPCYKTSDARLARVEYNALFKQQPLVRMTYDIELIDLTKHEQYVWLVYGVRQAIRKYYDQGRKYDDLKASLALERQLDNWNTRTRTYLNSHPNAQVDEKGKAFFILVESWRDKWHKFFACKKSGAVDNAVLQEMKKECTDYEKQIDKYVNSVIGL